MIQTKILDLCKYKNTDDLARDLDSFANNEGYLIQCCAGKKNNLIILQRAVQQPQYYQQQQYQPPQQYPEYIPQTIQQVPTGSKKKVNEGQPMFPNAVYP